LTQISKPRKFRLIEKALAVFAGLVLSFALLVVFLSATGARAPDWARTRFVEQLNAAYSQGAISISSIRLAPIGGDLGPTIVLQNVELRDKDGNLRASLPLVNAKFDAAEIIAGKIRPVTVVANNAELHIARDIDGRFNLSVGEGGKPQVSAANGDEADLTANDMMAQIEGFLDIPALSRLERIEARDTKVLIDDDMTRRSWEIRQGVVVFENTSTELSATVRFNLAGGVKKEGEENAWASFGWRKKKGADVSEFSTKFSDVRAEDVADQFVAFDWLRVLDAPISGSMALDMRSDGTFGEMHGVLDVGGGVIRETEQSRPVRFTAAKTYLSYDQNEEKFTFDEITINTAVAQIVANGHIYLSDRIDRTVGAVIAQLQFTKVRLSPEGIFDKPVEIELGALDMRVQLDPLVVDIGQLVLVDGDMRVVAKGKIEALEAGWKPSIELDINDLAVTRMLDFWPLVYKPQSRDWMVKNINAASLYNVKGVLRGEAGQKPVLNLGFDLKDASVRFLKTLPPIENATGYGVLGDGKLNIVVQQGLVNAPDGGQINVAGTVFQILNTRIKKSPAELRLKTQSTIPSLLSLLDMKPFEFMSKAGLDTDLAQGTITTNGLLKFPLVKKVTFDLVDVSVEGKVNNASSDKLFKGKTISAETLNVAIDNEGLTIAGQAQLGKLPVSGVWYQKFGPDGKGKSQLEGQIEVSQRFLDEFNVKLPKGAVQGKGIGHIVVDLVRDSPAEFKLVSDLNRVRLAIDALGWRKAKNVKGRLEVRGRTGSPAFISLVSLKTKGLVAKGSIKLKPDGKLELARIDAFKLENWMDVRVDIRSDANGNAAYTLTDGMVDFRKSRFGSSGSDGTETSVTAKLDRLILSSGIALTSVEGKLSVRNGVTGSFSGRVNGEARIVGTLAPFNGGTGVRFTSTDAGAVFRSAGLFSSASGGRMDMILVPSGNRGIYNGTLNATKIRVRNASALAELLSALSVVGLLEQLSGEGIPFSDVEAKFRLTPTGVELQEGSAVGASLGLTMDGNYDSANSNMDMRGVITPIYLLNGILEQTKIFGGLFGKKKGEGLLGFNYTLKGRTDAPNVGVNPLSILAPGILRDVFRAPKAKKSN
jgi:uncharacterized protein DUF3971/AsmA-like protein